MSGPQDPAAAPPAQTPLAPPAREVAALTAALADRYAVQRELGRGGMATVYLAHDVRHDRLVALKVLNPELGAVLGTERFLAEIRVTAALQHPNLLPLFDSGEAAGLLFYVMPYVEGETLRARLERERQLPVDEAVRLAVAVAQALDYAHSHGVIHRDLKPENILLQHGQPVVADFGIALAVSNAGGQRVTQTGLSLGTPQYMSPEQATGDRIIDGRTDIYALGAVLYELLTGEPPHAGTTAQAIIAKLMTEAPRPVTALRHTVPPHVAAAVERALEKLPADRFQSARELADAVAGRSYAAPLGVSPSSSAAAPVPAPRVGRARGLILAILPWVVAAAAATGAGSLWLRARGAPHRTPVRFMLDLPPQMRVNWVAITPDGRHFVIREDLHGGNSRLLVRPADQIATRVLDGADNTGAIAISPDSRWIAFGQEGNGLRKISVGGGPVLTLARRPATAGLASNGALSVGLTWTRDGRRLVFGGSPTVVGGGEALQYVSASGGEIHSITSPDPALSEIHHLPVALRDGRHVAFESVSRENDSEGVLAFASLETGRKRTTQLSVTEIVGMVDDWLLFTRPGDRSLWAVRVGDDGESVVGEPVAVLDGLGSAGASVSDDGTLVYLAGADTNRLAVMDERGTATTVLPNADRYVAPRLSPDGRRLAFATNVVVRNGEIWVHDLGSGITSKVATGLQSAGRPEWTPDGRHLVYVGFPRAAGPRQFSAWIHAVDGSAPPRRISIPDRSVLEAVPTPDGRSLVLRLGITQTRRTELWVAPLDGTGAPRPILVDSSIKVEPRVSPDGRWLAYRSDESGVEEVYVRTFPGPGGRIQVSSGGGREPVWSRDGRTLYYRTSAGIMAARLETTRELAVAGRSTALEAAFELGDDHQNYDIFPDDRRFLVVRASDARRVVVVVNWHEELRARLAAGAAAR